MGDMNYVNVEELDPGIRKTVLWLRSLGYETTDSGDGKTKPTGGDECALTFPHVVIRVRPYQLQPVADGLMEMLRFHHGVEVTPMTPEASASAPTPTIEASYNPADGIAIVMLYGVDDSMLKF